MLIDEALDARFYKCDVRLEAILYKLNNLQKILHVQSKTRLEALAVKRTQVISR